jgi:glycosyltransferase involved in cell wall biosynthesis
MSKRLDLSVILPAYNESQIIEKTLGRVDDVVKQTGLRYEIVVVDDGSTDDTRRRAYNYAGRNGHVKVAGYKDNAGKGYAVRTGFEHARGDSVIFIDSDLDINPTLILRFLKALNKADIVIGSKWHPQSVVRIPLVRKVLSHAFNILVRIFVGVGLRDTQTGLKAARRETLEKVFPTLGVKRFAYDVELLTVANLNDMKIIEMPVSMSIGSLFNPKEILRMFIDLLRIACKLRIFRAISDQAIEANHSS